MNNQKYFLVLFLCYSTFCIGSQPRSFTVTYTNRAPNSRKFDISPSAASNSLARNVSAQQDLDENDDHVATQTMAGAGAISQASTAVQCLADGSLDDKVTNDTAQSLAVNLHASTDDADQDDRNRMIAFIAYSQKQCKIKFHVVNSAGKDVEPDAAIMIKTLWYQALQAGRIQLPSGFYKLHTYSTSDKKACIAYCQVLNKPMVTLWHFGKGSCWVDIKERCNTNFVTDLQENKITDVDILERIFKKVAQWYFRLSPQQKLNIDFKEVKIAVHNNIIYIYKIIPGDHIWFFVELYL